MVFARARLAAKPRNRRLYGDPEVANGVVSVPGPEPVERDCVKAGESKRPIWHGVMAGLKALAVGISSRSGRRRSGRRARSGHDFRMPRKARGLSSAADCASLIGSRDRRPLCRAVSALEEFAQDGGDAVGLVDRSLMSELGQRYPAVVG